MVLISLICLLALSSPAFARYPYGSYSTPTVIRDLPVESKYGPAPSFPKDFSETVRDTPLTSSNVGSPLSVPQRMIIQKDQVRSRALPSQRQPMFEQEQPLQQKPQGSPYASEADPVDPRQRVRSSVQQEPLQPRIQESPIASEADTLCHGHSPETVITLDGGRRFIICIDDGKGLEQSCPIGLICLPEQRRCERKFSSVDNPCLSQPCLNGGRCIPTDAQTFKCECTSGFDGKTCELDATVCQTQQPCGSAIDSQCQSFRRGAGLTYMCTFQNGRSYGLNADEVHPSPCKGIDGIFPLASTDKGFIMCAGEFMHVASCPGGTAWSDLTKGCGWAGMSGVVTPTADEKPKTSLSDPSSSVLRSIPAFEQSKFRDTPVKSYLTEKSMSFAEEQPRFRSTFRDTPVKSTSFADESPIEDGTKTESILSQQERAEPVSSSASRMVKTPTRQKTITRQYDTRSLPSF